MNIRQDDEPTRIRETSEYSIRRTSDVSLRDLTNTMLTFFHKRVFPSRGAKGSSLSANIDDFRFFSVLTASLLGRGLLVCCSRSASEGGPGMIPAGSGLGLILRSLVSEDVSSKMCFQNIMTSNWNPME